MVSKVLSKRGYVVKKKDLTKSEILQIKRGLTVTPQVINIYSFTKPESYEIYRENNKKVYMPRFFGIDNFGEPDVDKLNKNIEERDDMVFNGQLRDYQKNITDIMYKGIKKDGGGILTAGCGRGKTVMAIYLACKFKMKTLVIVHTGFLITQWKQTIQKFTNCTIGTIRQKKFDVNHPFTIGMLQSISKKDYDKKEMEKFDLVIFDEVHHVSARTFSKSLFKAMGKYMLGLPATPKRKDGLSKVFHWYIGKILYKDEVERKDTVIINTIEYDYPTMREYKTMKGFRDSSRMNKKNSEIFDRNQMIVNEIIKKIRLDDKERYILVVSRFVNHLKLLKDMTDDLQICTTGLYIGGMKEWMLEESKTKDVMFATYNMVAEAFDNKRLNTLVMVTSLSNSNDIEQCVGRVRREMNPVKPRIIYDIIDDNLKYQYKNREKVYKKQNFIIN